MREGAGGIGQGGTGARKFGGESVRSSGPERKDGKRGRGRWWIYLYIYAVVPRGTRRETGEREREPLAARALYYIIGGHFGPPKSLSEHKKYEVLLGPPFFRAASGAAPLDRTVTEKGGAKERDEESAARDEDRQRRERARRRARGIGRDREAKRERRENSREVDRLELRREDS